MGRIVPGLTHTSLVSISTLCDAGCKVEYDGETCTVYFNKRKVWTGQQELATRLQVIPLCPIQSSNLQHIPIPPKEMHQANSAYTMSSNESLIQYLHQALFSPSKATLIKAINNNQLASWPGLTTAAVNKYLPDSSPATNKGHMKRQKKSIRSTTEKLAIKVRESETQQCINPPMVG